MATWTNLADRVYRQVATSTFVNQLIENTRWLKENLDRVLTMLEPAGTRTALQTTNTGGITTTAVNVLSATLTVPPGKSVKALASITTYSSFDGDLVQLEVRRGSTVVAAVTARANSGLAATGNTSTLVGFDITPTSGSQTYSVWVQRAAGSGTVTASGSPSYPGRLILEVL